MTLPSNYPDRQLIFSMEGGAVYTVFADGKYLLIVDESASAWLLDDDGDQTDLVKVRSFSSEQERYDYVRQRWPHK